MKNSIRINATFFLGCLLILLFSQCMIFDDEDEKSWLDNAKDDMDRICNNAIKVWYADCDYYIPGMEGQDAVWDCINGGVSYDWTCHIYCYDYPVDTCSEYYDCVSLCKEEASDDDVEATDS